MVRRRVVTRVRRLQPPARAGAERHRLHQLHTDLTDVITELRPGLVSVESVFSHPERAATGVRMGHARGVILLAAAQHGVEVVEHPPAQVKKALTGDGSADKTRMQSAIMTRCGLTTTPEPPDVADALAIALCAAQRLDTAVIPNQDRAVEPPR